MNALTNNKSNRLLSLVLFIPCFFIIGSLNSDIWFILNSGRYVLHNGFPHIEPFTIHEGMSFVMQQWLASVIFWISYSIAGKLGLYLVVILIYFLFVYMSLKLSMLLSDDNFFVSYALTLLVTILICLFMTERPYIFMFLFITIELYSLERYIKFKKSVYLMPLIALSVLLSNLQAAMWPILYVILLPYLIDSFKFKVAFIKGHGYGKKSLIITLLCMIAAGFLNPYGAGAVTYLFKSYGFPEINTFVQEMKPVDINTLIGRVVFATIFLVILIIINCKKGKYRLRFYLLTLGTAYLAFSSVRSYPLFLICGIIPLAYYLKDYRIKSVENKNDKRTLLIRKVLISLLAAVSIFALYQTSKTPDKEHEALVNSADFLENYKKDQVKLYTGFNDGGYLEFRGFKVYLDPRAEVFLDTNNNKFNVMKEFTEMQSGRIFYKEVLDKYNFTHLLVNKGDILNTYLPHDDNYKLVYSSEYYKVYENKKQIK